MRRPQRYFVIESFSESVVYDGLCYWSNKDGWGDLSHATVFTEEERKSFDLPLAKDADAAWMPLPPCLMIDPRFIEEEDD